MGYGEEYWDRFDRWYKGLSQTDRDRYDGRYPEPSGWKGFYARKREHLNSWRDVDRGGSGSP
jgi:hypothetical protein